MIYECNKCDEIEISEPRAGLDVSEKSVLPLVGNRITIPRSSSPSHHHCIDRVVCRKGSNLFSTLGLIIIIIYLLTAD